MDAATIEEMNRQRLALGMQPLPVPGKAPPKPARPAPEDGDSDSDEEAPSTLESREAQAYENYKAMRDAETAKTKREERAAAVRKAREKEQRSKVLEGKGLGEDDGEEGGAKAWLKGQAKRQKKIAKSRKLEEEKAAAEAKAAAAVQYTSKDLSGVKVAHDMASFDQGHEQILTLKDTTIEENEEEGDELENLALREQEKRDEAKDLKKKPVYNPYEFDESGDQGILTKYDEEIYGKSKKAFTLNDAGEIDDILNGSAEGARPSKKVRLGILDDAPVPSSDYLDVSEIRVKKPKKKKKSRQRADDDDELDLPGNGEMMDLDFSAQAESKKRKTETQLIDDEDLQDALSKQRTLALKKRKKARLEDFARQVRDEDADAENNAEETPETGLVVGEVSEFVAGIRLPEENERKSRRPKAPSEPLEVEMEDAADDNQEEPEEESKETSAVADVFEEKTVAQGLGATLSLLRDRGYIAQENNEELHTLLRQKEEFLTKKARMEKQLQDDAARQRERDRVGGRLDRMSARDAQEWSRQQNIHRDQQQARRMAELFQDYKPSFQLKYHDEQGRELTSKEAFKELSHQFHGKTSGPSKRSKYLKKIEEEKRRESQSIMDASQNVGMSSVTAQQLKKRREAGVRLA